MEIIEIINGNPIVLRLLQSDDLKKLEKFLQSHSPETKNRFAPHRFELHELEKLFNLGMYLMFVAKRKGSQELIAYFVVRKGVIEHEKPRLESYGLHLDSVSDCTFAPSVADSWQNQGIGNALFKFTLEYLKSNGFKRILLWGGVQTSNEKAMLFYQKNGFIELGRFEYYGWNCDMLKEIR